MANSNLKTVLVVDDSPTLATLFSRAAENMDIQLEICDKTSKPLPMRVAPLTGSAIFPLRTA